MKKVKKGLAVIASTVLMVTSAINYHGLAFATDMFTEESITAESVSVPETKEIAETTLMETETAEITMGEEKETILEENAISEEEISSEQEETLDERETELEETIEDEQAEMVTDEAGEMAVEVTSAEMSSELQEETGEGFALYSLLPLEEKNVYLILTGFSDEEIKAMPVSKLLSLLQDSDGNFESIPEEASIVWTRFKDEDGNVISDERHVIDRNETVDLSPVTDEDEYQMELIVGSGHQLDPQNIRYIVKVYFADKFVETMSFDIYAEYTGLGREKIEPIHSDFSTGESNIMTQDGKNIELLSFGYVLGSVVVCNKTLLSLNSELAKHPRISVEVYDYQSYMINNQLGFELFPPITDQILNQDMSKEGSGYSFTEDTNAFVVLYYLDGMQVDIKIVGVLVAGGYIRFNADLNTVTDEGIQDVVYHESENNGDVWVFQEELKYGYPADAEYYFHLDVVGEKDTIFNEKVEKIVVGHYDTLEEAAGQKDIKEDLLFGEGYLANYGGDGVDFTVFYKEDFFADGTTSMKITMKAIDYSQEWREFTDAPIVGDQDPWFRMTGAIYNGNLLDTYVVENNKSTTMDTLYGYHRQTLFINGNEEELSQIDLSRIEPVFWPENDQKIRVFVEGREFKPGSTVDFSQGPVEFHILFDDHVINYEVTVVKKEAGAQLYVFGPDSREIFLDEYFEYKHEILIANYGDEPLTGLQVTLDATNVKLDDYWTVGGTGNDTLAAFTATSSDSQYGELANLAKIRLLPDGDGDISGTLTITCNECAPVVIHLSGQAKNPEIVTTNLDEAVKFVPYSCLIATNNMYDWTDVSFTLTGDLPEGINWYPQTGEIYGVPLEAGTFPVTIEASFISDTYIFDSSSVELVLTVRDNSNVNVYEASDDGYDLKQAIGIDVGGYDFVLTSIEDTLFVSNGEFSEFENEYCGLWLNGQKLEEGIDYEAESGSTRITIYGETFENYADQEGTNTIAAEFRVNGDREDELKRTSQNFRFDLTVSDTTEAPTTAASTTAAPETEVPTTATPTTEAPTTASTTAAPTTEAPTTISSTTEKEAEIPVTTKKAEGTDSTEEIKSTISTAEKIEETAAAGENRTTQSESESDRSYVNCTIKVVDGINRPVSDLDLELHSIPQKALTNSNGYAVFNQVEFGIHTLYVKAEDGNVSALKEFSIIEGNQLSIDSSTITAQKGSDLVLTFCYEGDTLELISICNKGLASSEIILGIEDYAIWIGVFMIGMGIMVLMICGVYGVNRMIRKRTQ